MTSVNVQAQFNVAINTSGTPDASSILDVNSPSMGLLIPRMSTTNRDAIVSPANGLILYNTSTNNLNVNTGLPGSPNFISLFNGSANTPLTYSSANGFAINQSNTSTNGYLLSSDWGIFSAKQTLLNNTASLTTPGFITFTGTSPSYDNTLTYCSTTGTVGYLPKFTAANALGNSLIYDNGTNVGINLTNPTSAASATSTLQVNGSFATAIAITDNSGGNGNSLITTLATKSNSTLIGITASGNKDVSFTLPNTSGISGRIYSFKNIGAGIVTLNLTAGQTIDGLTTYTLANKKGVTIQTNGSVWYIIGIATL